MALHSTKVARLGILLLLLAVICGIGAWYFLWPYPEREVDGLVTRGGNRVSTGETTAIVSGHLIKDPRGCLTLEDAPENSVLTFERGTVWANDEHTALRLPNGAVVTIGAELRGGGGWTPGEGRGVGRCVTRGPGNLVSYWSDR